MLVLNTHYVRLKMVIIKIDRFFENKHFFLNIFILKNKGRFRIIYFFYYKYIILIRNLYFNFNKNSESNY